MKIVSDAIANSGRKKNVHIILVSYVCCTFYTV